LVVYFYFYLGIPRGMEKDTCMDRREKDVAYLKPRQYNNVNVFRGWFFKDIVDKKHRAQRHIFSLVYLAVDLLIRNGDGGFINIEAILPDLRSTLSLPTP
jgi:hypothetical protein